MDKLTREIKEKAKEFGADLVGIANIARFKGVPAQHHPSSIFPEAKSVIVVGFFIPRGLLRGIEEGTYFNNYTGVLGSMDFWLPWFFHRMVNVFEEESWEAVPIFPHTPDAIIDQGVEVSPDKPAPNVGIDVDLAAVRAGLGEIGYHGLFLSPEFGPLQKLFLIITDAPLTADPVLKSSICDRCMACVKACPLKAISDEEKTIRIVGKEMRVGKVKYDKCKRCQNGAFPSKYPLTPPDRIAALCGRECLIHLEKKGILKNKWATQFRKRTPWMVVDGEPLDLNQQELDATHG